MRLRPQIAGAFAGLLLLAAYFGFSTSKSVPINDKLLHFITFFLLTLCFYWVIDTSRRRVVNFTLIIMFGILGVGSEFVQGMLPWRVFDPYDILANLVGCSGALGLCTLYHKRMLERKRQAKSTNYHVVGNEEAELGIIEEEDEGSDDEEAGRKLPTTNHQDGEAA